MKAHIKEITQEGKLPSPHSKRLSARRSNMELVLVIVMALIIRQFFFSPTVVQGTSMHPTLEPWDFLVENKWNLRNGEVERGMIVILDPPHDDGREFIKRVIGLPGDTIQIVDGVVSVNGKRLDEPYVGGVATWTDTNPLTVVVPEGEYFVMGDNRAYMQSNDSRSFGTIPLKAIKGQATYRYFPFGESFGPIK